MRVVILAGGRGSRLAGQGQVHAFRHQGFWHPMDTLKEKQELTALWLSGQAPWKKWD